MALAAEVRLLEHRTAAAHRQEPPRFGAGDRGTAKGEEEDRCRTLRTASGVDGYLQ